MCALIAIFSSRWQFLTHFYSRRLDHFLYAPANPALARSD
jgi:hypothetical protein